MNATGGRVRRPNLRLARFQRAPTLGGECYKKLLLLGLLLEHGSFNGHPPLGVNATKAASLTGTALLLPRFNGHPPLGVNATGESSANVTHSQWEFQRAPTLGGECYEITMPRPGHVVVVRSFNGHPPLGVNATSRWGN